jgi:hypothetical protein
MGYYQKIRLLHTSAPTHSYPVIAAAVVAAAIAIPTILSSLRGYFYWYS